MNDLVVLSKVLLGKVFNLQQQQQNTAPNHFNNLKYSSKFLICTITMRLFETIIFKHNFNAENNQTMLQVDSASVWTFSL